MRRTALVTTVLVSAVVGMLLAVLAPSAAADSSSGSGGAPGNRGWVADPGSSSGSFGLSDHGGSSAGD